VAWTPVRPCAAACLTLAPTFIRSPRDPGVMVFAVVDGSGPGSATVPGGEGLGLETPVGDSPSVY